MITLAEIRAGVTATWLLVKGNPEGLRGFDFSEAGFWRSFQVIVPLLPAFAIGIAAEHRYLVATDPDLATVPLLVFLAVKLAGEVVNWFGAPLLLAALAGPLGIAPRFAPLITATNWASLLAAILPTLAALGFGIGLLSDRGAGLLGLIGLAASLAIFYRVSRMTTGCSAQIAMVMLLIGLIFAKLIGIVTSHLVG